MVILKFEPQEYRMKFFWESPAFCVFKTNNWRVRMNKRLLILRLYLETRGILELHSALTLHMQVSLAPCHFRLGFVTHHLVITGGFCLENDSQWGF